MAMIRLPFVPGCVEWIYKQGDVKAKLAISDRDSPSVHIYDARSGSNESIASREVSSSSIFHSEMWISTLQLLRQPLKQIITCYIFWADTPGTNKIYEVQPWIRYCDFCRWQRSHWILESCYTSIPRNWVSFLFPTRASFQHPDNGILSLLPLFFSNCCCPWAKVKIWEAHFDEF